VKVRKRSKNRRGFRDSGGTGNRFRFEQLAYYRTTRPSLFFLQLGVAVGFVLPPMLVPNSPDLETVGSDLQMMFYLVAGLTSILLVLMVICKFETLIHINFTIVHFNKYAK